MTHDRLSFIAAQLEQLRQHVRPEGDAAFSAITVAMEQVAADAGEPAPALLPVESQLQAIAADVAALRAAVGV